MAFFNAAVGVLQTLIVALGASGDTELFEKHSNINGFWLSDNKISCL